MMRISILIFSVLLYSCSENQESIQATAKTEIEKDTLPRIEFKFPGEDIVFSIGMIPSFDTSYNFEIMNDSFPCKSKNYFIYATKNSTKVENFENSLVLNSDFCGLIFEYPKFKNKQCFNGLPSDYGAWEDTKHRKIPNSSLCFKKVLANCTIYYKYDTLFDDCRFITGRSFTDSFYLDFNFFRPFRDTIKSKQIWNSIYSLKFN